MTDQETKLDDKARPEMLEIVTRFSRSRPATKARRRVVVLIVNGFIAVVAVLNIVVSRWRRRG